MNLIRERFVDYLFMLYRGEIPPPLKPYILRIEKGYVYFDNGQQRGAILLGGVPYGCNMPLLGFALFGPLWPMLLRDIEKPIRKRWKGERLGATAPKHRSG